MNKEWWEKAVQFHGHECPGLAIGCRACEAAVYELGFKFSPDEEIVCVTENDACGVDAVQIITGCTFGKGNLIYRGTGKMAFSFFNRLNGQSLRVVLKPLPQGMEREERQHYILNCAVEDLFEFKQPHYDLPEKARIFNTIICENCLEAAAEHKMRLQDNKTVCLDCFEDYSRGW
jgi:formylmethanofuran dehydrogenase subunit E